ncbi:RNA polymerase sigma factor [Aureisphaera sp. CAU 1614]|uniref:RNA polymerase sigma factor n=1 Tax=Halomarinibacterium sedimenti TaxID=2857106 RepID=A0A9X1JUJ9_9FLAO|nr:RNA polymerase sigma factor [Halomarinibacterium sedimenti]MBW2936710.1 RNA polymerase sigma factor [Halomarinibacterium sedimenti]
MRLVSLHKNYKSVISRAKDGNRKAQQELYELFAPKMLSVCRQYIKRDDIAEEVMLTGFLKVFTYLNSYKFEGSFEGWIRRIMVNESISQLRKEKALFFEDEKVLEQSTDHVAYIETELEVNEIQKMIDELPDGYKTVFVLYAVEGYKHSEIAELLQISESTSKTQLFKARKALQNRMNQENKLSYGTH